MRNRRQAGKLRFDEAVCGLGNAGMNSAARTSRTRERRLRFYLDRPKGSWRERWKSPMSDRLSLCQSAL